MDEHDVAQVDSTPMGVVLVCACGHRAEARTKAQADVKHEGHRGVEIARGQLEQGRKGEAG